MPYPKPFTFAIDARRPLLVMSCSATKSAVGGRELVRFGDLYAGPMWQQVKASGFPMSNVAAISALYGFLEPGMAIETYNCVMDEERAALLCGTSNHVSRLARAIEAAAGAFIVGGGLYQSLARQAIRIEPELAAGVTFARGSYLQQRKQLRLWLEAQGAAVAELDQAPAIASGQLNLFAA